jgi:chaperonin GroES
MAVGRGRRLDDGQVVPLDVKAGDRILFGKYTGSETKVDGAEYTIIREDDVLAILNSTANGNT